MQRSETQRNATLDHYCQRTMHLDATRDMETAGRTVHKQSLLTPIDTWTGCGKSSPLGTGEGDVETAGTERRLARPGAVSGQ